MLSLLYPVTKAHIFAKFDGTVAQLFLDRDRNHVVICSLILSHQVGQSPLHSCHCAAHAFSFTSFASLTSSKPFTIRTSETPLPQLLYNPHLQAPLGSAGNKGLITPLESALTRNSPVSRLESALTKRWGVGLCFASGTRHSSLQPDSSSFVFIHLQALLHSPKTQPFCFHTNPR